MGFLYSLLFLVSIFCATAVAEGAKSDPFYVRTIIDTVSADRSAVWMIQGKPGLLVANPLSKTKKRSIEFKQLCISVKDGALYINGTRCKDKELHVYPLRGSLRVNSVVYPGAVSILALPDRVQLVNYCGKRRYAHQTMQQHAWWQHTQVAVQKNKKSKKRSRKKSQKKPETILSQSAQLQALEKVPASIEKDTKPRIVRVLLDEKYECGKHWELVSENGFILIDPEASKKIMSKRDRLTIGSKKGILYVDKKKYKKNELIILPKEGRAICHGTEYEGTFMIVKNDDRILLINCIDLEDYLYSVVRFESWPGWPLEVNKAFAIASRSYVISMVLRAHKSKKPYHIKNTNVHQTYGGFHQMNSLKHAIEQTKGVFLAHDNKPIIAMFDSCCGGIVPAQVDGVDFNKAPYLAREYACTHCKSCSLYEWEAKYSAADLLEIMQQVAPEVSALNTVRITKRDDAGLVQEATVKSKEGRVSLSGKQLYSLLKEVKSFHFNVTHSEDMLSFKGKGYGHHLGLCQWGARQMVRDGWDYKSILQFYYPGTNFMRLY